MNDARSGTSCIASGDRRRGIPCRLRTCLRETGRAIGPFIGAKPKTGCGATVPTGHGRRSGAAALVSFLLQFHNVLIYVLLASAAGDGGDAALGRHRR